MFLCIFEMLCSTVNLLQFQFFFSLPIDYVGYFLDLLPGHTFSTLLFEEPTRMLRPF